MLHTFQYRIAVGMGWDEILFPVGILRFLEMECIITQPISVAH